MDLITVALHPSGPIGVRGALAALEGIELVCPSDEQGVVDALRAASVLVTREWRDEYFAPGLRWVQTGSAGHERFPLDGFRRRGIVLAGGRGLHAVVAEHAIGLLLSLTRDIHVAVRAMSSHRWDPHVAEEIGGRTVVLLGLGTIGEGIARRLAQWDVRVIGVTRTPDRYRGAVADMRALGELATACAEASVLFIALPSTTETRHLVSAAVLDALGQGWLVNVSRGALVDEAALIERLRDGRLRGAGLDVVSEEPLPPASPLWSLPNVVLTPHMGGHSPRYGARFAALFEENLRAFRGQGPWRNRIC